MNHFELEAGELFAEEVPLSRIAAAVGTPVYVYSTATLSRHYTVLREALCAYPDLGTPLIAYAVKANSNVQVLRVLGNLGAGADTVSEGEIRRALAAGIDPSRIVFSGVGKTGALGVRASIAFRVNPDVSTGGHAKIVTGKAENKFGVSFAQATALYGRAANTAGLNPVGVACHIGSQITDLAPMRAAFLKMRGLVEDLRAKGLTVERLDLGGGLGVPYFHQPDPPSPADYAAMIARVIGGLNVQLAFEPGRVIAANAGVLLSEVIHVNERPSTADGAGRRFLVLDAAMNDLIRPAMYEAYHDIRPVKPRDGAAVAYDVVGPVCETGDTFARDRVLPILKTGDLVAFMSAGAYGAAMASEYNTRPLVPEVLVDGSRFAVIRQRPTYEEIISRDQLRDWQS